MDETLYLHILSELQKSGGVRRLVLMLQNEPLLDMNLAKRVHQAKEILGPQISIIIVTNGSLLSPPRTKELFQAGMDDIQVSIDAYSGKTYALVRPGLDFNRTVQNTRALIEYRKGHKVTVNFLKQQSNIGEQQDFIRYWKKHGARTRSTEMSNRAGEVYDYKQLHIPEERTWKKRIRKTVVGPIPCMAGPFERLNILWDGRVIVCCQDWGAEAILGDLSSQSLSDIWNGELTGHYRDLLWHGRFQESPICHKCSATRYFPGKKND